ncbi:MAG: hypothetical protein IKW76_04280 [Clostridia bacterium]|nr:hypothetical protein [Clostridia bacterium]
MKRKLTALFLCAILVLCTAIPVFAEGETETGTLKILNYNVDGLPLPAFLSSTGRDPLACSKQIPAKLNAFEADIIAVQEDFNFHTILKNGIDAKYTTYHSGGIPFGDGLNYYSNLPLFNVTRVPWETAYGVFDAGSDELTPKGFLCGSVEIADGVYVDVYDMHADAYGAPPNAAARVEQYKQMIAFIEDYSKDHAVIVTGDTNTRFMHTESELKKQFIDEAGFKEAWVELCNDGNYDITYADNEKWGTEYWGIWDSVEKVFYRSGGGVTLEAADHEFVLLTDENGSPLSDHSAEFATLTYTIDRGMLNDSRTYEKEHIKPISLLIHHIRYFLKALDLVINELPKVLSGEIKISFK